MRRRLLVGYTRQLLIRIWTAEDAAGANDGALAQLGERLHGMQEVEGSIPLGSIS